MQLGKFNVVTDGQWGSCGKGLITTALADKYHPAIISTTNMANAGHTAVWCDGSKFVAKALPSASILKKWSNGTYRPMIFVGPTAAFHIEQLLKEVEEIGLDSDSLVIHPRAGVITDDHRNSENELSTGPKHVASTMQGCGTFLADKILRKPHLKLAKDYPELQCFVNDREFMPHYNRDSLLSLRPGYHASILHEGSQGFSLDINHGSHYPQCTSRSTTAVQNLSDMGFPSSMMGRVYLVVRPFPIRVGNIIEDGEVIGHSGGTYDDHKEITWEEVATLAGAPSDATQQLLSRELTTVTKRLRRVFTFSMKQLQMAAFVNGATDIALNFANYIDWSCTGCSEFNKLSRKVRLFIENIENNIGVPVSIVGTGPQNDHVCFR